MNTDWKPINAIRATTTEKYPWLAGVFIHAGMQWWLQEKSQSGKLVELLANPLDELHSFWGQKTILVNNAIRSVPTQTTWKTRLWRHAAGEASKLLNPAFRSGKPSYEAAATDADIALLTKGMKVKGWPKDLNALGRAYIYMCQQAILILKDRGMPTTAQEAYLKDLEAIPHKIRKSKAVDVDTGIGTSVGTSPTDQPTKPVNPPVNKTEPAGTKPGSEELDDTDGPDTTMDKDTKVAIEKLAQSDPLGAIKPTAEQQAIMDNEEFPLGVVARAGSGKTTVILMTIRARQVRNPHETYRYMSFNRRLAAEFRYKAAGAGLKNCSSSTFHKYAKDHLFGTRPDIHNKGQANEFRAPTAEVLIDYIKKLTGKTVDPYKARVALNAVKRWVNSAEDEMSVWDLKDYNREFKNAGDYGDTLDMARLFWSGVKEGHVPVWHNAYVKMFQLDEPVFSEDVLFIDEGQDMYPALEQFLLRSIALGKKVVVVGDSQQKIYGWNDAKDSMVRIPFAKELTLSESFRFGPDTAVLATKLLRDYFKVPDTIVSRQAPTVMGAVDQTGPFTYLSRTNAHLIDTALDLIAKGRTIAIAKPDFSSKLNAVMNYYRMWKRDQIRDAHNGKDTPESKKLDDEISDFKLKRLSFKALEEQCKQPDADPEHMFGVALVVKYKEQVPGIRKRLATHLVPEDAKPAPVILATVHGAKGREWDNVVLGEDFRKLFADNGVPYNPGYGKRQINPEEINLYYVAVTRARKTLQLNSQLQMFMSRHGLRITPHEENQPRLPLPRVSQAEIDMAQGRIPTTGVGPQVDPKSSTNPYATPTSVPLGGFSVRKVDPAEYETILTKPASAPRLFVQTVSEPPYMVMRHTVFSPSNQPDVVLCSGPANFPKEKVVRTAANTQVNMVKEAALNGVDEPMAQKMEKGHIEKLQFSDVLEVTHSDPGCLQVLQDNLVANPMHPVCKILDPHWNPHGFSSLEEGHQLASTKKGPSVILPPVVVRKTAVTKQVEAACSRMAVKLTAAGKHVLDTTFIEPSSTTTCVATPAGAKLVICKDPIAQDKLTVSDCFDAPIVPPDIMGSCYVDIIKDNKAYLFRSEVNGELKSYLVRRDGGKFNKEELDGFIRTRQPKDTIYLPAWAIPVHVLKVRVIDIPVENDRPTLPPIS